MSYLAQPHPNQRLEFHNNFRVLVEYPQSDDGEVIRLYLQVTKDNELRFYEDENLAFIFGSYSAALRRAEEVRKSDHAGRAVLIQNECYSKDGWFWALYGLDATIDDLVSM